MKHPHDFDPVGMGIVENHIGVFDEGSKTGGQAIASLAYLRKVTKIVSSAEDPGYLLPCC